MTKYHSKQVTYNGIEFDSVKEKNRYIQLCLLQRAGQISNLELQKRYVLIPSQTLSSGRKELPCKYVADFVYTDNRNGRTVVEDVKGYKKGGAYSIFAIKRKLMLKIYGIEVREV